LLCTEPRYVSYHERSSIPVETVQPNVAKKAKLIDVLTSYERSQSVKNRKYLFLIYSQIFGWHDPYQRRDIDGQRDARCQSDGVG